MSIHSSILKQWLKKKGVSIRMFREAQAICQWGTIQMLCT